MFTKREVDVLEGFRPEKDPPKCACGKAIIFYDESRFDWVHDEGFVPSARVPGMYEAKTSQCPHSGMAMQPLASSG